MKRIRNSIFCFYISVDMLICSLVFAPWVKPRETLSGIMGRWFVQERNWKWKVAYWGTAIIDVIHIWEPEHCKRTFYAESDARHGLYGKS